MVVSGHEAYTAFPDRVIVYNLNSLEPLPTVALAGVTAMTTGPDAVWAATGSTLVQLAG